MSLWCLSGVPGAGRWHKHGLLLVTESAWGWGVALPCLVVPGTAPADIAQHNRFSDSEARRQAERVADG
jgi:hypothetical protein